MTFDELEWMILDGAPDEELMVEAERAMQDESFLLWCSGIVSMLRRSGMGHEREVLLVEGCVYKFYEVDLPRFRETGSFVVSKWPFRPFGHNQHEQD